MTSGAKRLRGCSAASAANAGAGCVSRGAVIAPAGEADVQLLQLPIEVRALEPGALGDLAHVALLAAEELLEIDSLERFARLAQRKLEEARGDLRGDGARGRRRLAEEPLHVLGGHVAGVHRE